MDSAARESIPTLLDCPNMMRCHNLSGGASARGLAALNSRWARETWPGPLEESSRVDLVRRNSAVVSVPRSAMPVSGRDLSDYAGLREGFPARIVMTSW